MTKHERDVAYSQIAGKMGDLVFRYEQTLAHAKDLEQQMNTLRAQKKALEEAAVDDAPE